MRTTPLYGLFKKQIGTLARRICCALVLWIVCVSCAQFALRPIPRDLAAYMNRDINRIAQLENLALKRYGEFTGANYRSDQALRHSLKSDIIPVYERFANLSLKVRPRTVPVKKLHAVYRRVAGVRLQGLRTVLLAIDTQDPQLMFQANRMLEQGQHLVVRWREQLTTMSGHYGLALKGINDQAAPIR